MKMRSRRVDSSSDRSTTPPFPPSSYPLNGHKFIQVRLKSVYNEGHDEITVPTQWTQKAKEGCEAFTIVSAPLPSSKQAMDDATAKGKGISIAAGPSRLVHKVSEESF
jgi:hypothetical protein